MSGDPVLDAVTAPGTPFAMGERDGQRCFVNAPETLDQLIQSARRHGDKTFIVDGAKRLSYDATFALSDALAAELAIAPGERVAICMRNRAEWLIGFIAIIRAGGIAVLVNSRGSPEELDAAVEEVAADVVLADDHRAALLRDGGFKGRIISADAFPAARDTPFTPPPARSATDPAVILFTSGTTGRVKGAVLSHRNIITGVMAMQMAGLMVLHNTARRMNIAVEDMLAHMPQQAVLLVYPLFHISGLGAAFLSPLVAGSKVVILPKWDAADAAKTIAAEKITMFSAVPTMLWDMLHTSRSSWADLSSVRNIGTGGQALPLNLLAEIRTACPEAVMGTGYGLTECSGSISMAVGEDFVRKPAAAGQVLPLMEVRIEGDQGQPLPVGEAGEIVARGPQVMLGYWNRPEDTAAVLSADGWFRTGDVGYLDAENYLFIVDRKKDMVISGGENIYCAEVERVLSHMPEISECATFGIPDERLGELLVAVVRADGLSEAAVKHHVGEHLARYKAPAHVVFTADPLPRNHLDKVDKIALRASWPQLYKETR